MASVLLTGANRGIGLEFVRQFLARGDRVFAACRNVESADKLSSLQGSLEILQLDVACQQSMENLPRQLRGEAIDIFVNNAGIYGPKDAQLGKVDSGVWVDVLQINCSAPLLLTQLLIGNLRRGKDRKLVYITSKMGSIDDNKGGGSYIYRSSKTALNAVVKSLAVDLAGEGYCAVVLHPGWVLTDMGGTNALIDTATSVSGMVKVIDGLSTKQSGSFFNYDGKPIPW